jgi:uncharacterized protein YneF (UPF0154 family)
MEFQFILLLLVVGLIAIFAFWISAKLRKSENPLAKKLLKFMMFGTARKVSVVKCRNCGWMGTEDRWREAQGCPKCGSDLAEKTDEEHWKRV